SGTEVAGVTTAYHNLTGLSSGTTYSFKVRAYNNSGIAGPESACSANIVIDTSAPAAATGLVTAADSVVGADVRYDNDVAGIYLVWTAGTDGQSAVRDYTLSWYAQGNCG